MKISKRHKPFSISDLGTSQRAWVACISLIVLLSAGMGYLAWLAQAPDKSLSEFRRQFDGLRDMEARWDSEILSLQLGIAPNYDAVTRAARDLRLQAAKLEGNCASDEGLVSLRASVHAYRQAIEDKARLSEQVKASYSMLRNSVAVLPNAISDAYENPEILRVMDGTNKRVSDLLTEAIMGMVSFAISPTPLLRDAAEERISRIQMAARSSSSTLVESLNNFLGQVEVVLKERQRGNELMLAIAAVPTVSAANQVEGELQTLEKARAGMIRTLWDMTGALAVLLALVFVVFVVVLSRRFGRLDNDNRMLQQVNENVEEQLMQSAKLSALGQMVAGITHEINTPLAYVKAVFELIRERLVVSEETPLLSSRDVDEVTEAREELRILLDDGLHGLEEITTLIKTMKNFSRLDKGQIESFSVEDGLRGALLIAKPQTKYVADVKLEFDSVPPIMCSPSQIRQVFLNMIVNAVDAMATMNRRGVLTLRTRLTSSDTVQVDICDNGPGIPPEELNRIFDPFYTTKPVGEGSGMGLSICYRIIENHGGTITVNSKTGKGTIFTVTLPRQDEKFPNPHREAKETMHDKAKSPEVA